LIAFGLLIGIISGSYPAFYLSSFKPLTSGKGEVQNPKGGLAFRNLLVIVQFTISIFLIAGTIVIYEQLDFFQNKRLGFDKEQVLIVNNPGTLVENIDTFKDEIRKHSSITEVSGTNMLPGQDFSNIGFGASGIEDGFTLNIGVCDYDLDKVLKLEIVEGRFFSRDFESDSNAIIINERTADLLGWKDPINKEINNWSSERGVFSVIGIVKDFHYESLHQEIRPFALFLSGGYYKRVQSSIAIRLESESINESIDFVENNWAKFTSETPFEYSFLDENFNALYANEIQTRKLFTIFSILAIFIACLGLFGLASFIAEQKTKEIGIRKVLGASTTQVVRMLNSRFVKWVLISSFIALPAAWIAMEGWLRNFAYRIDLSWWMFVLSAGMAFAVAILIVSFESIKAAFKNPVDSLKYE
jgi:putative ABC transport system permease protein